MAEQIGFLHPGEMGAALAAVAKASGNAVWWSSEGRSMLTASRARDAVMEDAGSLAALCHRCRVLVSICPPQGAVELANRVAATGFDGLYIDANAISPASTRLIRDSVQGGGARFVDAAVIGPPPREKNGGTRLYLSGETADSAAVFFSGGALQVQVLGPEIGAASALKMCDSAMRKGVLAMLFATLAGAESLGIRDELEQLWTARGTTYLDGMDEKIRRSAKAWRFAGEMEEVAHTFEAEGMPPGFHLASKDIFLRLPSPESGTRLESSDQLIAALLDTTT